MNTPVHVHIDPRDGVARCEYSGLHWPECSCKACAKAMVHIHYTMRPKNDD